MKHDIRILKENWQNFLKEEENAETQQDKGSQSGTEPPFGTFLLPFLKERINKLNNAAPKIFYFWDADGSSKDGFQSSRNTDHWLAFNLKETSIHSEITDKAFIFNVSYEYKKVKAPAELNDTAYGGNAVITYTFPFTWNTDRKYWTSNSTKAGESTVDLSMQTTQLNATLFKNLKMVNSGGLWDNSMNDVGELINKLTQAIDFAIEDSGAKESKMLSGLIWRDFETTIV